MGGGGSSEANKGTSAMPIPCYLVSKIAQCILGVVFMPIFLQKWPQL